MSDEGLTLTPEALAIIRGLKNIPAEMTKGIAAAMRKQNALTISHIQKTYASFGKGEAASPIGLRVQSNRYRQGMWSSTSTKGENLCTGAIGNNVKHARIHEFGGTIPAHTVRAKPGKSLRFTIGGTMLFRKKVEIPAVEMPARAPIQRGVADKLEDYGNRLSAAIVKASEPKAGAQ